VEDLLQTIKQAFIIAGFDETKRPGESDRADNI
jgi:hypothetical protein